MSNLPLISKERGDESSICFAQYIMTRYTLHSVQYYDPPQTCLLFHFRSLLSEHAFRVILSVLALTEIQNSRIKTSASFRLRVSTSTNDDNLHGDEDAHVPKVSKKRSPRHRQRGRQLREEVSSINNLQSSQWSVSEQRDILPPQQILEQEQESRHSHAPGADH